MSAEPTLNADYVRETCPICGAETERGPSGAWWHIGPSCQGGLIWLPDQSDGEVSG